MKRCAVLLLIGMILMACTPNVPAGTTDKSVTPSPTPAAFETTENLPENKFLFIVVSEDTSCGIECNCPAVEGIMDPFRYKDGTLYLLRINFGSQEPWAETRASKNAVGFYVYRSISMAQDFFIASFPYKAPNSEFMVNGANKDGAISVRTDNHDTILQPGQNFKTENVKLSGLCSMKYTSTIKNHGLLDDSQVEIIPEGEYYP